MTKDDIIRMAREANIKQAIETPHLLMVHELERFAQLVAASKCKELSEKLKKMPLNDTANSIAIWIREQE